MPSAYSSQDRFSISAALPASQEDEHKQYLVVIVSDDEHG